MSSHPHARHGLAAACALVAVATTVFGLVVVHGISSEYAGGAGLQLLPFVVLVAGPAAGLAAAAWPGSSRLARWGLPLAVVVVVGVGGLAADRLGDHAHEQRLLSGSETFGCNGPNAEVLVDDRVDATFAALPRRAPLYGPVEGTRDGCTAAVDGEGATTFTAYAAAFRTLDGWRVTVDRSDRFVMERDGVRVVMRLDGAPDQLALIEVAVPVTGRAAG